MTELHEGSESGPEAAGNASRGRFLRPGARTLLARVARGNLFALLIGLAGGALLAASDFLTLIHVQVLTASCSDLADPALADTCVTKGHEQHNWAFLVLGLVALVMAYGAGVGRSRAAAAALGLIGLAALLIVLIGDLPDVGKTGAVGIRFADAEAKPGPGFWAELAGSLLILVAGVLGLTRARRSPPAGGAPRPSGSPRWRVSRSASSGCGPGSPRRSRRCSPGATRSP
jgi:hypothetical protein